MPTNVQPSRDKNHRRVSWALLVGLLVLRLPLMAGSGYAASASWLDAVLYMRLDAVLDIFTYILTLGLIWWERDALTLFHIDALSIVMIIFFKPLQTLFLGITFLAGRIHAVPSEEETVIQYRLGSLAFFAKARNCASVNG